MRCELRGEEEKMIDSTRAGGHFRPQTGHGPGNGARTLHLCLSLPVEVGDDRRPERAAVGRGRLDGRREPERSRVSKWDGC